MLKIKQLLKTQLLTMIICVRFFDSIDCKKNWEDGPEIFPVGSSDPVYLDVYLTRAPIPELSTLILLGFGLTGLVSDVN